MNWYKLEKKSSNNIKFPENIEEDINEATEYCVNYYFERRRDEVYIGDIGIFNPYTNKKEEVSIVIIPNPKGLKGTSGTFNPQNRTISIRHDKLVCFVFDIIDFIKSNF